jgi:hypothetical protein
MYNNFVAARRMKKKKELLNMKKGIKLVFLPKGFLGQGIFVPHVSPRHG